MIPLQTWEFKYDGWIYDDVDMERISAHKKHGPSGNSADTLERSSHKWLPILTEELGEVARCLCEASNNNVEVDWEHLREELIQVAAMACAWVESVDRGSE